MDDTGSVTSMAVQREGFISPASPEQRRRDISSPPVAPINPPRGNGQAAAATAPEPPVLEPAPEPEAPPVVEETWPIRVKLVHSKGIRNHRNELIEALTFRAPTGGDINRCGNPVRINQDGDVIIDERKMTLMMASLSGVLSPILDTLDTRDWNSAAYRLRPFFMPEPGLAW